MSEQLQHMEKAEAAFTDHRPQKDRKAKGRTLDRISFWAFIAVEVCYFVLCAYALEQLGADFKDETDFTGTMAGAFSGTTTTRRADLPAGSINLEPFNAKTRYMFIYATGTCLIMNFILIFFMARLAGFFVWLGPAMLMVYLAIGTGLGIWKQSYIIAGGWGAFLVLMPLVIWTMRKRFQLGRFLLETTGMLAKENPSVFGLTVTALFVQFFFGLINIFGLIGIFLRFQPQHKECQNGTYCSWLVTGLLCAFGLLAHLWLSGVISNVVLTALAGGPFSTHYFYPDQKGERGAWRALREAVKKSFGSICFGTLFVGGVHLLNGMLSALAQPHNAADGGCAIFLMILAWLLAVPLKFLDWLLQHFNKYVYIFIAIGKRDNEDKVTLVIEPFEETYFEAGVHCFRFVMRHPKKPKELVEAEKNTKKNRIPPDIKERIRQLAQSHGISTLINDDITTMALTCACISTAVFCMVFTWVYMYFVEKTVISDHWYDWAVLFYAFILGLLIGLTLTSALEVGVSTLFVCMSENINLLERLNPEFFDFITKEYPFMFEALHQKGDAGEGVAYKSSKAQ